MKLPATLCLILLLIFEPSSFTEIKVTPGSSLELPCFYLPTALTDAPATWKFNDEDISQLTSPLPGLIKAKKNGLILTIFPVTAANSGRYECSIKDSNMELSRIYNIEVVAANAIVMTIVEGQSAYLPCQLPLSGPVTTNALWFKGTPQDRGAQLNFEDISADNRIEQLYPNDYDQTIIIRHIALMDEGVYRCISEGKIISSLYLEVRAGPTPVPYSCAGFTEPWEPCLDEKSRTGEPMLQESLAEFSMQLFSHFRQSEPSGNLLFSPISIGGALSHLLLGARGDTRKAIERAMFVPHDFHCVHFQMKKLRDKLDNSLQMASQIYYNPQISLTESFINQSTQFYEAEPKRLLENSDKNAEMINTWAANKTNNKIRKLVDSVSPDTQLMLLNAVSFSGQWKVRFDPNPRKGNFRKLNGDIVNVPVLYHESYTLAMMYNIELHSQVARFMLTDENSLYIIVPRSVTAVSLQQLEEKMTDTAVRQMMEMIKTTLLEPVEVTLPQIKLDVQPDLNMVFKKLGLSSLFEDAKLCGLNSEERLVLDDTQHRAVLELNEHGVEAGAVTSFSFSRSFPSFSALQPFIMLLWSDQANVPLFIGRVTDP